MPSSFRILSFLVALAVSFFCVAGSAVTQDTDISRGEDLAAKHCAGCHETSADKGREQDGRYVPSLREVANAPHYSLVRLRRIISVPPHRDMPNVALDSNEINDVAAYIRSLRTKAR